MTIVNIRVNLLLWHLQLNICVA